MVNITVLFTLFKPDEKGGNSNHLEHCRGVYNVVVHHKRVLCVRINLNQRKSSLLRASRTRVFV